MKSKRKNQIAHAKRRMLERVGYVVGESSLNSIVNQIRGGKAKFVRRSSNRVTVWDVVYEEKKLRVVYDKLRKSIVTVYQIEA